MTNHPLIYEQVQTQTREQIVDLTPDLQRHVDRSKTISGMMIVYVPHTTAAVTINENFDADVKRDLLKKLSAMIPKAEDYYRHDEGNSDSHLKTALVGNSATILIESGKLVLGRWQGVYFCEFDGARERSLLVKIIDWA